MKTGVEQAACILAMISTQEEHKLVSSDVISSKLKVSSSYLKKMLRKLVVHERIVSVPGNQGGIRLTRPPQDITIYDVFVAIEEDTPFIELNGLIPLAFPDSEVAPEGEALLNDIFAEAQENYFSTLKKVTVADVLKQIIGTDQFRIIDWNQKPDHKDIQALRRKMQLGDDVE